MYEFIWIAIAIVMAIIEGASQTLITVWFFVGAVIAAIAAAFGLEPPVQIAVFVVASVLCLLLFRPALKKRLFGKYADESYSAGPGEATPLGQDAIVTEEIDNGAGTGRVETPDHMSWTALSSNDERLEVGTRVKVVDVQSVKLVVERIDG